MTELTSRTVEPFLRSHGLSLYHTEFVKEGKDWYLRVFIDREPDGDGEEAYVSTDDCELVSRFLSEALDREDPIRQPYYLEVSSPGLDRILYTEADFARFSGRLVDVRLYEAVYGSRQHQGILVSCDDACLVIRDGERELRFDRKQVHTVRLAVVI